MSTQTPIKWLFECGHELLQNWEFANASMQLLKNAPFQCPSCKQEEAKATDAQLIKDKEILDSFDIFREEIDDIKERLRKECRKEKHFQDKELIRRLENLKAGVYGRWATELRKYEISYTDGARLGGSDYGKWLKRMIELLVVMRCSEGKDRYWNPQIQCDGATLKELTWKLERESEIYDSHIEAKKESKSEATKLLMSTMRFVKRIEARASIRSDKTTIPAIPGTERLEGDTLLGG